MCFGIALVIEILRLNCPFVIQFQGAVLAKECIGSLVLSFEMPVEPGKGNRGILATVRPTIVVEGTVEEGSNDGDDELVLRSICVYDFY